jgi:hypothetical protein
MSLSGCEQADRKSSILWSLQWGLVDHMRKELEVGSANVCSLCLWIFIVVAVGKVRVTRRTVDYILLRDIVLALRVWYDSYEF